MNVHQVRTMRFCVEDGELVVHVPVPAGKARAVLAGRFAVNAEDIRSLARPVLRHRIIANFHAEVSSVNSLEIVDRLLDTITP